MGQSESVISVFVVEDDAALRREFVAMIDAAPGMMLVEAVGNLTEARAALKRHEAPDVLIIDLGLPDGDGAALISELATIAPATSALVVTIFGDEGHVVRALEAGAKGYLLKDAMLDEFARAVRLVHAGGSPLSPTIARHLLKRFTPTPPVSQSRSRKTESVEILTPREAEILQLIAAGHSIAETAATLELSPHTVSTHVKHIYGKLAVSSRVQAVNRARATGQID
jgi:DNA-binding NarL/FixJ family response regulator